MAIRVSTVLFLFGASVGLETRKPADMSDLKAVADFASSAADIFLDAAKALPSPAEAQAALAAQDESDMRALLADDVAAARGSLAESPTGFLSAPSADASVANIRFVEPSDAVSHDVAAAQDGLDVALAALERRQRSSEARFAAVLESIGDSIRR